MYTIFEPGRPQLLVNLFLYYPDLRLSLTFIMFTVLYPVTLSRFVFIHLTILEKLECSSYETFHFIS